MEGIRRIGNAAELGAELRTGATVGAQPLRACERRETRQLGRQSASEVGDLVIMPHLRRQRGCHRQRPSGGEALGHDVMLHMTRHVGQSCNDEGSVTGSGSVTRPDQKHAAAPAHGWPNAMPSYPQLS